MGADALSRNGLLPDENTRIRMIVRPIARIAPAMPAKISICRRRRCGPSEPGFSSGGGGSDGGGVAGGRPGAVTVPDANRPPGCCQENVVGSDMNPSEHHAGRYCVTARAQPIGGTAVYHGVKTTTRTNARPAPATPNTNASSRRAVVLRITDPPGPVTEMSVTD
ncbi:hypothetical protein Ate02nite_73250 [Paractinoplanes tereljensis]|uniref:Uncharacterized protein n=1 Tax=Paractinoplanes tereljensis TaxID=571912 RepID=A0A919NT17_9ACTN|nr:hypothetical protein Ate02nite_73250 [Actinoplanes tereljensis]